MINFIICDDVQKYREMAERVIDSYMMKNKLEYKTHIFKDYDSKFMEIVESRLSFKVYILDIEAPTKSGIDIARIIRTKDVDSVLIFLTGHQELGQVVMKNDFLFLSFINKFDNCEQRLKNSIDKALQVFKVKSVVRFKDNGIVYAIPQNDILYITRDSVDRKCIIVTDYNEEMVNNNFVKTHRACLMNSKRILSFSKSQKQVIFDNGMISDLVSTRFDKELV